MRMMNKMLYTVFAFQLLIIILFAALNVDWNSKHATDHDYIAQVSILIMIVLGNYMDKWRKMVLPVAHLLGGLFSHDTYQSICDYRNPETRNLSLHKQGLNDV
jgi:hypothetical protein